MARIARILILAPALLALACVVETDRDRYAVGDAGTGVFRNRLPVTAWLSGCSLHAFERLARGDWIDRGPGLVCVWEGFAQPVEPGESVAFELRAPDEPGIWRLAVEVGLGCASDRPLVRESCRDLFFVYSDSFEVRDLCGPRECGPALGMPNILCPDGVTVAGPTDRCLRDLQSGLCGWEVTRCPEERGP